MRNTIFKNKTKYVFVMAFAVLVMGIIPQKSARAQTETGAACCSCPATVLSVGSDEWGKTVARLTNHAESEFQALRIWMISVLWEDNILPAMMLMSEQLTAIAMKQVEIFGTYMDAKHQMETQQVLQKIRVQSHKDYHPSEGLCEFGTSVKSLAASETKGELNAFVMSQRAQDRNLGNAFSLGATGRDNDIQSRIDQFKKKYCEKDDNNKGLDIFCDGNATPEHRRNKDIDFVRTVIEPGTLDIDFSDKDLTETEEDVFALAANLYGHNIFERPTSFEDEEKYLNLRAIAAKRSVAENSYNAIIGMKSKGTDGSAQYLKAILEELGAPELADSMGDEPSYWAQMEILGKKVFQNPDFYTNLYDKPVNIDRKAASLQAIALMQKFDLFKSYLRQEASLSILLELAVVDLQEKVESRGFLAEQGGQKAP